MHVTIPMLIKGYWTVIVKESPSPFSKVIDEIPCGGREAAWKTYKKIKKELGQGY